MQLHKAVINYGNCIITGNVRTFFVKTDKNIIPGGCYYIVLNIAGSIISLTNIFYPRLINGNTYYEIDFFANKIILPFEILQYHNYINIIGCTFIGIDEITGEIKLDKTDTFTDIYYQIDENFTYPVRDFYTKDHVGYYSGSRRTAEIKIIYHNSEIMNYLRTKYYNNTCKQTYGITIDNVLRCISEKCGLVYYFFDNICICTNNKKTIFIVIAGNPFIDEQNIRVFDNYTSASNYAKDLDFRVNIETDIRIIESELNDIEQTNFITSKNNTMSEELFFDSPHCEPKKNNPLIISPIPISHSENLPLWMNEDSQNDHTMEDDFCNTLSDIDISISEQNNINIQLDKLENIINNISNKKELSQTLDSLLELNSIDPYIVIEPLNLNLPIDISKRLYCRLLEKIPKIFNISKCDENQLKGIYIILNSMISLSNMGITYELFDKKIK